MTDPNLWRNNDCSRLVDLLLTLTVKVVINVVNMGRGFFILFYFAYFFFTSTADAVKYLVEYK